MDELPLGRPICFGSLKVSVIGGLCACEFLEGCSEKFVEDNYEYFKKMIEDSRKRVYDIIMCTPKSHSQGYFLPETDLPT